jgi:uncharacterized protein YkwD
MMFRCLAALAALLMLTGCPGGGVIPLPGGSDDSLAAAREAMIERHNDTRLGAGLDELAEDSRLDQIAQEQAEYMASIGDITHDDSNGNDVRARADSVAYDWILIGENVGYATSASTVYSLWLDSPGHYSNITQAGYSEIGVGRGESGGYQYWCVVFGNR